MDLKGIYLNVRWECIKMTYIRHIFIFLDVINKLYVV